MSGVPICERLRRKVQVQPAQGSGGISFNRDGSVTVAEFKVWDDGKRLANPDGPEAADILEFCELTLTEARQFVEHYPVHSKQDQHGKTLMLEQIDAALAKVTP